LGHWLKDALESRQLTAYNVQRKPLRYPEDFVRTRRRPRYLSQKIADYLGDDYWEEFKEGVPLEHIFFKQSQVDEFKRQHPDTFEAEYGNEKKAATGDAIDVSSTHDRQVEDRATGEPPLRGKKAIGKFLGVTSDTVDKYISRGMRIHKKDGRIFAYPSEVNAWLRKNSRPKGRRPKN